MTGRGKSDVYVTGRSLGSRLKVSLHESGNWHLAYDQQFLQDQTDSESKLRADRFIDKWQRPPEISPGVTLAYRVAIPSGTVSIPQSQPRDQKIVWLTEPPQGKSVWIGVFIARADWQPSPPAESLGSFPLDDGTRVWCLHRVNETPGPPDEPLRGSMAPFRAGEGVDIKNASDLRAVLFGSDDLGRYAMEAKIVPAQR